MHTTYGTIYKLYRHFRIWSDFPPACRLYSALKPEHCPRHSSCERVRAGYHHRLSNCSCRELRLPTRRPEVNFHYRDDAPLMYSTQVLKNNFCSRHATSIELAAMRMSECRDCRQLQQQRRLATGINNK